MSFTITSPAFASGASIPKPYTCQGTDISPAIAWSGDPTQTVSFALIVDDPDAPVGTWVHWVIWNIPPSVHQLPENVAKHDRLDSGAVQGQQRLQEDSATTAPVRLRARRIAITSGSMPWTGS